MASDTEGKRIGRYKICSEIGRGGMAVVYQAFDTSLERNVALKLLHPHLSSNLESRERFQREARAVARLKHPSILEIFDFSCNDGEETFLVMELVEGTTLRLFLDQRGNEPIPAEAAAMIVHQFASALIHAHENGVVHRDVKPENILISPNGSIKLSDFGIAHLIGQSHMTTTGQILGSPAYMSPEHIERTDPDARADIFSAGIVLYEVAVGRAPFEGKTAHAIIKKIIDGEYDNPLNARPAIGHHIAEIIQRCLKPRPEDRYSTTAEMVADLEKALLAMGIDSISQEIGAYLADPAGWTEKTKPQIVSRTLNLGISARRERRLPEAIDHFNRVLALDPGNEKALAEIAGLSLRKRILKLFEFVAVAAAVLVVLGAITWVSIRDDSSGEKRSFERQSPRAADARLDAKRSDNSKPINLLSSVPSKKDEVSNTDLETESGLKRTEQDALKSKQKREVVFTPQPMAVEIVIDGKERFSFGPTNRKRQLSVGAHTIQFIPNDPKRFVEEIWKVNIPPGKESFQFRERLRWSPAKLLIRSNADAVVTIPGRATGRTNQRFEVNIVDGPEEQVSVLVSAEGYIPKTNRVTIGAGEILEIEANLQKAHPEL